jgi:hypothetical protein
MENDTLKGFLFSDVRGTQHKKKSQSETKRRVSIIKIPKEKGIRALLIVRVNASLL